MTEEQLKEAIALTKKRTEIKRELALWTDAITHRKALAYYNLTHRAPAELKSNMSEDLFAGFRRSVIDNLKLKIAKADQELADL